MQSLSFVLRGVTSLALAAVAALPLAARAAEPTCHTVQNLSRFSIPLRHLAEKLSDRGSVTIVAIGSSSTQGAGASSPAANYPSRLRAELQKLYPHNKIVVINQGIGGEEVPDMLKRFDDAVVKTKPDLVLWQLGTNSVVRGHMSIEEGTLIRAGLKKIRLTGADVVLIDPQFAPKVIAKPEARRMVELIAVTAKQENVDLFRRYDVMKRWHDVDHLGFDAFVSPDGLHMNDWSYACMAKGLGQAIAAAAQRPVVSATASARAAQ
ncbi:MAG TPA: SGNH/GDSL hydrolase family protein [Pseudolabrys sp.]|nr:SGNH/GDSL hydrolase family protein [Pseudolabrys sp.]